MKKIGKKMIQDIKSGEIIAASDEQGFMGIKFTLCKSRLSYTA